MIGARAATVIAVAAFSFSQPATADDSATCAAAAHRFVAMVTAEAKGTRHEAQIAAANKDKGEAAAIAEFRESLNEDHCAFLMLAPDSTIRALAIAALPERNGK
jgi:hypothetical protein